MSFSSALTANQLAKQQPVKATAVRLARVQDPTSALGLTMPGLSALLAGTPSEDTTVPGISGASSLYERLTAASSTNQNSQPASPMTSPPPATPPQPQQSVTPQPQASSVGLQGVNLASLPNSINGLQNVQVILHCRYYGSSLSLYFSNYTMNAFFLSKANNLHKIEPFLDYFKRNTRCILWFNRFPSPAYHNQSQCL